jgi:GNAT superfamily N-acetyltransferase
MNVIPEIAEPHRPVVELRMATIEDVPKLVDLFDRFFEETHYADHLDYSPDNSRRYLAHVIGTGMSPHILAVLGGDVIGVLSYHIDRSFCAQPLAILDEVYVIPEFAGTPVGRALVSSAMDICRDVEGANCFHAVLSSGHKRAKTLVNLFKKFGAQEIGTVMRKVF